MQDNECAEGRSVQESMNRCVRKKELPEKFATMRGAAGVDPRRMRRYQYPRPVNIETGIVDVVATQTPGALCRICVQDRSTGNHSPR